MGYEKALCSVLFNSQNRTLKLASVYLAQRTLPRIVQLNVFICSSLCPPAVSKCMFCAKGYCRALLVPEQLLLLECCFLISGLQDKFLKHSGCPEN